MKVNANTALTGNVYVHMLAAGYTYGTTHNFETALTPTVGVSQYLGGAANKTYADGTFKSTKVITFSSVTGPQVTKLALYIQNAGANTTWKTFLYLDTSVTGLPVTPNGGNITITWDAAGIVTL